MNDEQKSGNQASNRWYDVAALFLVLIYALQPIPKTNAADTNKNDPNDDRIVKYTGHLTVATWVIAIAAIFNLGAALLQWRALSSTDLATHDLAKSAIAQVNEMRDQQRPIILTPAVGIVMPITFDASTKDAQITLDYTGVNVGHSVAAHFHGVGKASALSNVGITFADYETVCKVSDGFGRVLNVNVGIGQPISGRIAVRMSRDEIEKCLTQSKDTTLNPIIAGCLTYHSASSNEYFQTPFAVIVTRKGRGTLDLATDPIPAAELSPLVFPAPTQQNQANQH